MRGPLIALIIIILVGAFLFYFYNFKSTGEIVLSLLQKDLEFCEIVREDAQESKGVWLICNNRPFYTVYDNGKLTTEMNGWGFLKDQPEILNELKEDGCDFYNYADNSLVFVCKNRMVKSYSFSESDFKLSKLSERPFVNYFSELNIYNCDVSGSSGFKLNGESFIQINEECGGHSTVLAFNLDKMYYTLPIVIDERLPGEERVSTSFQLLNKCELDYVQDMETEMLVGMVCGAVGEPSILYDLESGVSNFLIDKSEFENLYPYLWKYNLPFLKSGELEYIQSTQDNSNSFHFYSFGDKVIVARESKDSGIISEVYPKYEGIYSKIEREIQYVDDCEAELLNSGRDYVLCCQDNDEKLYLCNDKRVFSAGEYIGMQINLQKLNKYFNPYHECAYSNLPVSPTPLPEKYEGQTVVEDISGYSSFVCSKLFYQEDYHHLAMAGYVENVPGEYIIGQVWVFPDQEYETEEDFRNNIDKAVLIFNLTGEIR